MSRFKSRKQKTASAQILGDISQIMTNAIADADEQVAAQRVADLREDYPHASAQDLAQMLIKRKCMRAGAVGAVTSGAALIPGLGTAAALTFGVAADIGMTFLMQAELVLEIAAVHAYPLDEEEKRKAVMVVTGISAGANQALRSAGTKIAERTSQRLAEKSIVKAIPVVGVGASAGTNILTTYIIGQRAHAYFSQGPEAMGDWAESVRAIAGVDERKLMAWLSETTENSWPLVKDRMHSAADLMIVVGKSTGELAVVSADKARQVVSEAGRRAVVGAVDLGKRAGKRVAEGLRGRKKGVDPSDERTESSFPS